MHALFEYQSHACSRCGTFEDEWVERRTDAAGNTRIVLRDPPPYDPEPIRCHGCDAIETAWASVPNDDAARRGLSMTLRPVPTGDLDVP